MTPALAEAAVQTRGVQPTTRRPHATQDGYECDQHKILKSLKTFFLLISFC